MQLAGAVRSEAVTLVEAAGAVVVSEHPQPDLGMRAR